MLIVEGPDRAGKTTLSKFIAKRHVSDVRHLAGSKVLDNPPRVLRHWGLVDREMWEFEHTGNRNVIYDRMVLGSMVYAFKADHHNILPVTEPEYAEWMTWLARTDSIVICALPPLEVLLERMKEGETYISQDDMIRIHRHYAEIFKGYAEQPPPFGCLFYDSSVYEPEAYYQRHHLAIQKALGLK